MIIERQMRLETLWRNLWYPDNQKSRLRQRICPWKDKDCLRTMMDCVLDRNHNHSINHNYNLVGNHNYNHIDSHNYIDKLYIYMFTYIKHHTYSLMGMLHSRISIIKGTSDHLYDPLRKAFL